MEIKELLEIATLEELREYLSVQPDADRVRERLYAGFLEYAHYRTATEWNVAVKLCEALAIVGWGDHEPLEAVRATYFNGNPNTFFLNRDARSRFFEAVWSKRKEGFAIDFELSFDHGSAEHPLPEPLRQGRSVGEVQAVALCNQRNWIPKNPIRVVRGLNNCYPDSRPVAESIDRDLMPMLNRAMRPEAYGTDIAAIVLNVSFSYYDHDHCKTNYIIADEALKLRRNEFYPKLLEMYPEREIKDNGYELSNRFTVGAFRKDTGTVRVGIVLEKEFSRLSVATQKQLLSDYLVQAVEKVAERLARKLRYDFPLLIADFRCVLDFWNGRTDALADDGLREG